MCGRCTLVSTAQDDLRRVLEGAREAGFLGPGPVETHIAHASGFAEAAVAALGRAPEKFLDLGTGGGVPGLVLAQRWTGAAGVFVDSARRRCAALREAVQALGLGDRIEVLEERAEGVAHPGEYRAGFGVVTARSFGAPAVTAEIASGLVAVGGVLVVSDPPDPGPERWPAAKLEALGFGAPEAFEHPHGHFVVIRKVAPTPERFPRAVGRPAKRPLW
jgi:16S rRNA (guanine527-N7)-methyltransferase